MNQPLAHLYFLTVMEHLYVKCKDWPVPALLSIIQQCDAVSIFHVFIISYLLLSSFIGC